MCCARFLFFLSSLLLLFFPFCFSLSFLFLGSVEYASGAQRTRCFRCLISVLLSWFRVTFRKAAPWAPRWGWRPGDRWVSCKVSMPLLAGALLFGVFDRFQCFQGRRVFSSNEIHSWAMGLRISVEWGGEVRREVGGDAHSPGIRMKGGSSF